MHSEQALVLFNASAPDRHVDASQVLAFAKEIKASVEREFGLQLEIEPICY